MGNQLAKHESVKCCFYITVGLMQMCSVQAVQVRKCNYVPDTGRDYDPDSYHECTIFAGTVVRQVSGPSCIHASSLSATCLLHVCYMSGMHRLGDHAHLRIATSKACLALYGRKFEKCVDV